MVSFANTQTTVEKGEASWMDGGGGGEQGWVVMGCGAFVGSLKTRRVD